MRHFVLDVIRRFPDNMDALSALVDVELWNGNIARALVLSDSALVSHPNSDILLIRKARSLANLGRIDEAKTTLQKALHIQPKNEEAIALKKRLGF